MHIHSIKYDNFYSCTSTWHKKENNNLILHNAANVISISIDFPADNTVHPTKLSASDKTITISYHTHTAGNTPTQGDSHLQQQYNGFKVEVGCTEPFTLPNHTERPWYESILL